MNLLSDDFLKDPMGQRSLAWEPSLPDTYGWRWTVKRTLDLTFALGLMIILSPLLALIAVTIRLDSSGPILFRQVRSGKNGRPFSFLKFRSMVADAERQQRELEALNEADGPIFKIRDDPRVTRVGRILRRTSLDELPQLWNVLRGDMSLVGPRPPLPSEVLSYAPWQHKRLAVTPGVTGLWQVSGRSDIAFEEMVRLDIEYILAWSLWLDVRILVRTLQVVITAQGAY